MKTIWPWYNLQLVSFLCHHQVTPWFYLTENVLQRQYTLSNGQILMSCGNLNFVTILYSLGAKHGWVSNLLSFGCLVTKSWTLRFDNNTILLINSKRLTFFLPLIDFHTPWKHQKTRGFLVFSGGMERHRWHKKCKKKVTKKEWSLPNHE